MAMTTRLKRHIIFNRTRSLETKTTSFCWSFVYLLNFD
ncbi:hypothetical protein JCM19233_2838 [Vibrio astriarenae]|nr:hypothetical protein JCM19233_2838 [Vibrio sp. C7]